MDYIAQLFPLELAMAHASNWPLPENGIRFFAPRFLIHALEQHPLGRDMHTHGYGYYPRAQGHQMQRHEHDDHLLIYCTEGYASLRVQASDESTEDFTVTPGDLVLLPKGLAHQYRAHPEHPWSIYWVHFDGALAHDYTTPLGFSAKRPCLHIGHPPRWISDFQQLVSNHRFGFDMKHSLYSANLLKAMLACLPTLTSSHQQESSGLNLEQIHGFMDSHLFQQLNLDQLAEHCQLSKYHLVRRYKALTGHTPIEHFIHKKMEYACQLLDNTNLSIQAIAARLGYRDTYYFSRLFRKTFGISPSAYRLHRRA